MTLNKRNKIKWNTVTSLKSFPGGLFSNVLIVAWHLSACDRRRREGERVQTRPGLSLRGITVGRDGGSAWHPYLGGGYANNAQYPGEAAHSGFTFTASWTVRRVLPEGGNGNPVTPSCHFPRYLRLKKSEVKKQAVCHVSSIKMENRDTWMINPEVLISSVIHFHHGPHPTSFLHCSKSSRISGIKYLS